MSRVHNIPDEAIETIGESAGRSVRHRTAVAVAAVLVLLAGVGTVWLWPDSGGGVRVVDKAVNMGPPVPQSELRELWAADPGPGAPGPGRTTAAYEVWAGTDRLLLGRQGGGVEIRNLSDGASVGFVVPPEPDATVCGMSDGPVAGLGFVAWADASKKCGLVTAVAPATGEVRWTRAFDAEPRSAAAELLFAAIDTAVVAAGGNQLHAFAPSDGRPLWSAPLPRPDDTDPADLLWLQDISATGSTIVVASLVGRESTGKSEMAASRLDSATGKVAWTTLFPSHYAEVKVISAEPTVLLAHPEFRGATPFDIAVLDGTGAIRRTIAQHGPWGYLTSPYNAGGFRPGSVPFIVHNSLLIAPAERTESALHRADRLVAISLFTGGPVWINDVIEDVGVGGAVLGTTVHGDHAYSLVGSDNEVRPSLTVERRRLTDGQVQRIALGPPPPPRSLSPGPCELHYSDALFTTVCGAGPDNHPIRTYDLT